MGALFRAASLGIMGLLSIYFYYNVYPGHAEDKSFLVIFLFLELFLYICYKAVFLAFPREKTIVHGLHILSFFLVQLCIMCLCFFGFQDANIFLGIIVFFKISFVLALIALLWSIFYALGTTLLDRLKIMQHEEERPLRILISLGIGFTLYILGIFLLGFVGLYTGSFVLAWTTLCLLFSHKRLLSFFSSFQKPLRIYEHDIDISSNFSEKINLGKVVDEFHFGVISFLLSINFINIYRPFPIGWDDLGVYMNYPRLLAQSGELLALGKIYFWELYTGIGFLTGSQMFAFFLNSFSGVIAALCIYIGMSYFIPRKKTFFDIPLFAVMIMLSLPMTVFQLAKDMKLDYGLLSISTIVLFFLYYLVTQERTFSSRERYSSYTILGILIGTAFSIKFTSLLLLLGALGVIFYSTFSLLGLLSFLGIFLGIFTYLDFWKLMNVIVPNSGSSSTVLFSILSITFGIAALVYAYFAAKHKHKRISHLATEVLCVLGGFCIVLLPWGVKHIGEKLPDQPLSIGLLLNGSADQYIADFEMIYSKEEIQEKQKNADDGITSEGKVNNEDFGRYFGYERGINNYLKLPWNLSFQVNQGGEFTDISYIFFALIPLVFLFLPFRKEVYKYPLYIAELVLLLYYIPNPLGAAITQFFSLISLPQGYIFIFLFFLLPFLYLYYSLDRKEKISQLFLLNFAFSTVYVFLWNISAFGIVWYGVLMYVVFLFMISLSFLAAYETDKQQSYVGIYVGVGIVWVYIFFSVLPHGITNLRSAGYPEYKLGEHSEEVALLSFHPDYLPILFTLNIDATQQEERFIFYRNELLKIVDDVTQVPGLLESVQSVSSIAQLNDIITQLTRFEISTQINARILELQQSLYEEVISPSKELKNTKNIYRVGTFLKYFISENHKRVYEDSLLKVFEDYFLGKNIDETIQHFQKLGISYILLDLNAATIDQDPAQDLTKRYEKMLELLVHPKLKLIETDSICLKLALDVYAELGNAQTYMELASINYGLGSLRQQKQLQCLNAFSQLIVQNQVSAQKYPYLLPYKNALTQLKVDASNIEAVQKALAPYFQQGYKALFEILP